MDGKCMAQIVNAWSATSRAIEESDGTQEFAKNFMNGRIWQSGALGSNKNF
jgi:hypothetical protein